MASASTVAVVVPSPAILLVFEAASFTSCAPRFSWGSSSVISSATVTPSLVTLGAPQPLSRTALRPRGPRVVTTARANLLTPAASGCRASSSYTICFATVESSCCGLEHLSVGSPAAYPDQTWQPTAFGDRKKASGVPKVAENDVKCYLP